MFSSDQRFAMTIFINLPFHIQTGQGVVGSKQAQISLSQAHFRVLKYVGRVTFKETGLSEPRSVPL